MKKHLIKFLLVWLVFSFTAVYGQQTRSFERQFKAVGSYNNSCWGYITFDATFTGFAGRMSVKNTQLYLVNISNDKLLNALKADGVTKKYYSEIGTSAYRIPRFTLYMEGYTQLGGYTSKIYSQKPFKLQVSEVLGDYTTPEFDIKDKSRYAGDNSWENTGSIADSYPASLGVTEIYFKDYDIRMKN